MSQTLDWKRVRGTLFRDARALEVPEERLRHVQETLPEIIGACGTYSQSRRMAMRVGRILLASECPEIIVPTCPAYPSSRGRFRPVTTLGGGVSLVTRRHVPFLLRIQGLIPYASVTILVANHESRDPALQRATGLTQREFASRIASTVRATRRLVGPFGWRVNTILGFHPTFLACRAATIRWIASNPRFEQHITSDTLAREHFYSLFCAADTFEEKRRRTLKTAAEYMCLGRYAERHGCLVVNHTTTNLAWYLPTGAGVLHHHVSVY